MNTITIKQRYDASILFSYEKEDNTIKDTLEEAVRKGAYLNSAYLSGADLRDAALSNAELRGANLRDAALSNAELRGAALSNADLYGADLRGADLRGANLHGADLRGANLHDADLSNAELRGADLSNAELRGADLTNTKNMIKLIGIEQGNIYWKKIGDGLINEGYQFKVGLNELREGEIFADDERILCSYPGFHFASKSWCEVYYSDRPYLAKIRIPLDAKINEPWTTNGKASADKIEILQIFDKEGKDVTKQFK